jgi:predicted RND superfamily exporter protein
MMILVMVAAIFPASKIESDFNLEGFFPADSPTLIEYQMLSDEFGRDDNIIGIAFESTDIFQSDILLDLRSLTDSLELIPNITEVFSLWSINRFVNEDDNLVSEPYLNESGLDSTNFAQLKADILNDPFAANIILNQEATVTAVYLKLDDEVNTYPVRVEVIENLRRTLANYDHKYDFKIAGIPYFRNQYVEMLNKEMFIYIAISSLLIMIILWGLFGNVRGVVIPMSIVWLTILFTVAIIVLTGGYFEVMSGTIAPILLCVGVADSVHLLAKYQDGRINGLTPGAALRDTIIILGGATLLTSVTTSIGFITLFTSDVIPMKRFGVYTAIGVMIAFIVTVFVLPSVLPYFKDNKADNNQQNRVHVWLGKYLKRVFLWTTIHYKPIVITSLMIMIAFAYGATKLKVNGKIFDDVGEDQQVMLDSNFFNEKLTPQFPFEFVIDTGEPNGALSPELLHDITRFESFLTTYNEIQRTVSLTTLVSELHKTMSPELAAVNPLPQDPALIAQYMLLLELTDPDAATTFVDFDYQKIRLASNMEDVGSYRVNQMRKEIEDWLHNEFPSHKVYVSGTTALLADLTNNMVPSLLSSIVLAFIFISIIMGWLFKDWKLVIISLLPNVIPLIITAGVMGFIGVDIKPATAVIFTIAFGIVVDDSLHFLSRLRIEIKRTNSLQEAIGITTEKTGRAIILTSVILATGFGTLATSAFSSTMLMGSLVTLTIGTAVLADLLLLPALLIWIKPTLKTN